MKGQLICEQEQSITNFCQDRGAERKEVLPIIKLLGHILLFKREKETLAANRGTLSSANINISDFRYTGNVINVKTDKKGPWSQQ